MICTGNSVVDSALEALLSRAEKENIQVTCMIYGSQMNFMPKADISKLLEAVWEYTAENVLLIPEPEKRQVWMKVCTYKNFVYMETGHCWEESRFGEKEREGKAEEEKIRMKQIQNVIKKYGGNVTAAKSDSHSVLKILIPKK